VVGKGSVWYLHGIIKNGLVTESFCKLQGGVSPRYPLFMFYRFSCSICRKVLFCGNYRWGRETNYVAQ